MTKQCILWRFYNCMVDIKLVYVLCLRCKYYRKIIRYVYVCSNVCLTLYCHYNLSIHNYVIAILQNIYHAFWSIIFWKSCSDLYFKVHWYRSLFVDFLFSIFESSYDKNSLSTGGHHFHQYQQNEQSHLTLNIVTTKTYKVGNLSRGLRQAQSCGGIKPVNVIITQSQVGFTDQQSVLKMSLCENR